MATTLEENTQARKARLLALRNRAQKRKADDEPLEDIPSEQLTIVHRNFDISTGQAKRHTVEGEEDTIEKQVAGLSTQIVAEDALRRQQDLDLLSIQPKKPNWDLKRDVEKKLSKLESQTKASIAQLIRKRMAAERAASKGTTETTGLGDLDLAKATNEHAESVLSDADDD